MGSSALQKILYKPFEPNDDRLEASVVFDGEMIPGTFGGAPHNFTGGS